MKLLKLHLILQYSTVCTKLRFFTQLTEESESLDQNKSAGLGKKMKAISLTMRRKMGKKHVKSFSEETVSHMEIDIHSHKHSWPPLFYLFIRYKG